MGYIYSVCIYIVVCKYVYVHIYICLHVYTHTQVPLKGDLCIFSQAQNAKSCNADYNIQQKNLFFNTFIYLLLCPCTQLHCATWKPLLSKCQTRLLWPLSFSIQLLSVFSHPSVSRLKGLLACENSDLSFRLV